MGCAGKKIIKKLLKALLVSSMLCGISYLTMTKAKL